MRGMNVLFVQNRLCARGWKEAKVLSVAGHKISLAELSEPDPLKDYSIFHEHVNIDVKPDIRSMIKGKGIIIRELKKIEEKGNFDIIHSHNEPDNLGVWMKKNLSTPLVHDIHDLISERPIAWATGLKRMAARYITNRWESHICTRADGILSTSPMMIEHIQKIYRTRNIAYVMNKPVREKIEKLPKIDDGKVHLVYAGGVSLDSGNYRYVWPLFRKICASGAVIHLYSGGDREKQIEIEKKCRGMADLQYHKPIPQNDVIREISKYHYGLAIFSFYSKNALMATQNRVFEYQIAGLPVISNSPGLIGDYIRKKGCGEVIERAEDVGEIIKQNKEYNLDTGDCYMDAKPILKLYEKVLHQTQN